MDPLTIILIIALVFLGLYYLGLWFKSWFNQDSFWDGVFGIEQQPKPWVLEDSGPKYSWETPKVPTITMEPPAPRLRRSFGQHSNPALLDSPVCQEEFEQFDSRTWQCPKCGLLRFEK